MLICCVYTFNEVCVKACFSILLTVSFTVQKILILMRSILFYLIFDFMYCVFVIVSKNSLLNPKSSRFSSILSSKVCDPFELIYIKSIKDLCLGSYFCMWICSYSCTIFEETFSPLYHLIHILIDLCLSISFLGGLM